MKRTVTGVLSAMMFAALATTALAETEIDNRYREQRQG